MPSDDHPLVALKRQFELEDTSTTPIARAIAGIASQLPLVWPFDGIASRLKEHIAADSFERLRLLIETCAREIVKNDHQIREIKEQLGVEESRRRAALTRALVVDASRRVVTTRSLDRVKRVAIILVNGVAASKHTDGDEIEEMMRVATELSDNDVRYLQELYRIEGSLVATHGRVTRYDASTLWDRGFWGGRIEGEIDSVFSKLESYGLVARIPPPNNINALADFQNRYVLLKKGWRFVNLTREEPPTA